MNPISGISAISGVSGVSGISGISGISGASGISGVNSISGASTLNGAGAVDGSNGAGASGGSFLDNLSQAFGNINSQLTSADASMANFAGGGSADIHTVMLQMEEASISLKTAVQVRDKLLEAYSEIMRTQV